MATKRTMILTCFAVLLMSHEATAIDNGLGQTPPMGWRSWNCYHGNINQDKMTTAADMFVDTSRGPSLKSVGFINVGLDDYYQACGTGINGSFHNASGYPLIDKTKFPDMKKMTDHAHSLGLRMGWYANNCGCNEHQDVPSWGPPSDPGSGQHDGIYHYESEVAATIDFGFDGIKLDGCGEFRNLSLFAELFNKTGKPILIENCHWGADGPGTKGALNPNGDADFCPFNFFRTSGDIGGSWKSFMGNLQSTIKWQPWNGSSADIKTGPGCWAYPDMLEVGNLKTFEEDRAHFGAWCIVSAPLVLGHDLNNSATNDRIWPIITNTHAIAVNQQYAGHPGSLIKSWTEGPAPENSTYLWGVKPDATDESQLHWQVPSPGSTGPLQRNNMCVTIKTDDSSAFLELFACDGSAEQSFAMDANGNVHLSTGSKLCLAVYSFNGPGVVAYQCNSGSNEEFVFSSNNGTLCSKNGYCLASRIDAPPGKGVGDDALQMWAKPQPGSSVAVLVINGYDSTNHTVEIDLTLANFTGPANVFDVWAQKPIPGTFDGTFTTDEIQYHDSRFYLFSPAKY